MSNEGQGPASGEEKTKRWSRWLLFLAAQGILVAVGLEVGLRILAPRSPGVGRLLYMSEAETHWQKIDSLAGLLERSVLGWSPFRQYYGYVLNSRSLRTVEYSRDKPEDTFRALAFGDSFTFASGGLPHGDHWPTRLEEGLAARNGGKVQVLRFGVPGTGPQFQLRLWQLEGRLLDADLVVMGFFVGNDFVDEQHARPARGQESFKQRLAEVSYLARLGRNLLRIRRALAAAPVESKPTKRKVWDHGGFEVESYGETFNPERPTFSQEAYLEFEERRMGLTLRSEAERFDKQLADVLVALSAFDREVRSTGARFVVMIIPDEYQVDPRVRSAVYELNGRREEDYDLNRPQRLLTEALAARKIEHLDLLPSFLMEEESLYRPRDTHWNRAGNSLASELLVDYLARPSVP